MHAQGGPLSKQPYQQANGAAAVPPTAAAVTIPQRVRRRPYTRLQTGVQKSQHHAVPRTPCAHHKECT